MRQLLKAIAKFFGFGVTTIPEIVMPGAMPSVSESPTVVALEVPKPRIPRKQVDTVKLDENQLAFVIGMYSLFKRTPKNERAPFKELVDNWNAHFGVNKSERTYYRIIKEQLSKQ